jgi:hypothetical protein
MLATRPLHLLLPMIALAACTSGESSGRRPTRPDAATVTPDAQAHDAQADAQAHDARAPDASPRDEAVVRVGVPDAETNLYFQALEPDGPIAIRMGGQGGTHALIAVQCEGFGNRISYQISMKNAEGDGEVATLPLPRPKPIACNEQGVCKVSPIFVLLGGLAEPEDWDGLRVEVTATVSNEEGLFASDTRPGYLTRD